MKKITALDIAAFIVWLLPLIYLATIYNNLPASVPLHFNINGQPDRYGNKSALLLPVCILSGASIIIYLLLKVLPVIDPKRKARYSVGVFKKLGFGLIVFMAAINITIMYRVLHQNFNVQKIIFPLIGLLFTFLGNFMYSIKPNYFVGIRTPWTLESESTWRKTHQLASKLWMAGGIVITAVTLVVTAKPATFIFVGIVLLISFIPIIYSYIYFKKHQIHHS